MKKRIIVMLAAALTLGISQNLLQNPGFETWAGSIPEHWMKGDSVELFQEDVIVYAGTFSAKDSFYSTEAGDAELYQGMYAQPNTLYRLSFWVYDNDPAGRARGGVQWFGNGSYISSVWPNLYTVDQPSWQLWTYDLPISPSNADSVRFIIRGYDVGSPWVSAIFYVDDAYFGPPATQPPSVLRAWHMPFNPGQGVVSDIYMHVVDNGTIEHDTLFYGINELTSPIALTHTAVANDTFRFQIPGQTTGDTVFYYAKFVDNDGFSATSDTHAYYVGVLGVYVNELYYDAPGTDSLCFIEVFGPGAMSLDGFTLVGVNGNGGADYATFDLTGYSIPGDGFFVIGDRAAVTNVDLVDPLANLQNSPDNVEIRYHGIPVDALGYGVLNGWVFTGEWLPAATVASGHSLGRYPDGNDTDNNEADFHDYEIPSPGVANPPIGIVERDLTNDIIALSIIPNPVRSGVSYGIVVQNVACYPLVVYNTIGQVVRKIDSPESRLQLPMGVYFVRLNRVTDKCAKIIVVD
ncbi:MAG: hypothetical protein JSU64_07670 [candidate division WOR-3 bacterium]|nr:MAG: hypothetical protein JSU64_07670 [candidate division WOR-3 bacterium]